MSASESSVDTADTADTADTVDALVIWREEVSVELKEWIDGNDQNQSISKCMCRLERSNPIDLFDDHSNPNDLSLKMKQFELPIDIKALIHFYQTFDPDWDTKSMLFKSLLTIYI